MTTLENVRQWLEEIKTSKIPDPIWVASKGVFEFEKIDVETVAFLKAVRATQSLHSLPLLCERGLFSDFYTIIRSIVECVDQIYFLLETYPTTDKYVDQFVSHFTQTTIENSKTQSSHGISQHKIHAAAARARNPLRAPNSGFDETDKKNKQLIENIWTSLCNSAHSNYAEVMQCYGGKSDNPRFQLGRVPSKRMVEMNSQWIPEAIGITTGALHLMADRFKLDSLKMKIKDTWLGDGSLRP